MRKVATLLVRPRGLHLPRRHILVDGQPASGSLFGFCDLLFSHARLLRVERNSGIYLYLPNWNIISSSSVDEVFVRAQEMLGFRKETIKATVLIETILASFQDGGEFL